MRVDV